MVAFIVSLIPCLVAALIDCFAASPPANLPRIDVPPDQGIIKA